MDVLRIAWAFEPLQKTVAEGLERRLEEMIRTMDAESVLKMWAPGGLKGMEELQKAFWAGFAGEKGKESQET